MSLHALTALAIAATPPALLDQRLALGLPGLHLAAVEPAALPATSPPPVLDPRVSGGDGSPSTLTVGLVSVGMASIVLIAGAAAWWNRGFDTFRFNDTGMFGRDTYAGGADKLGHFYCTYVSMSAMTPLYEKVGISRNGSILGATLFTLFLWNGFEVIDGFTEYGVEYGDVIMNTLGISLGAAMQIWPTLPRVLGVRLGYVPSRAFLENDKSLLKFINDYAGMIYYLDVKLRGVLELSGVEPGLGRYVVGGLAFGTDAYSPVRDNDRRRRSFGVHVGLSLSEILRDFGDDDEGVEIFARFFDFYAVPFLNVALMKDLNGEGWFLNFGVANRSEIRID